MKMAQATVKMYKHENGVSRFHMKQVNGPDAIRTHDRPVMSRAL